MAPATSEVNTTLYWFEPVAISCAPVPAAPAAVMLSSPDVAVPVAASKLRADTLSLPAVVHTSVIRPSAVTIMSCRSCAPATVALAVTMPPTAWPSELNFWKTTSPLPWPLVVQATT